MITKHTISIACLGAACLTASLFTPLASAQAPLPFEGIPWVGYNAGSSVFDANPAPAQRYLTSIAHADLDGDGDQDAIVTNYEFILEGSGFAVLFNDGTGVYGLPVHYTASNFGSWDVAVGDFDEDGDLDVVVPVADATWDVGRSVVLFLNNGAGGFPISRSFTVGGDAPTGIAVADFDGDGHLDLATANHQNFQTGGSVSVLKGTGAGQFGAHTTYPVGNRPRKLAAGDLNGDGRPDLAVAHDWQQVSILLNNGTGAFGAPVVHDQLFPWHGTMTHSAIALGDSDNDGDLDLFYSNAESEVINGLPQIAHLRNDGVTFSRAPDIALNPNASGPSDLAVADFDGDGWLDVAGNYYGVGAATVGLRVVLGDGTGGFGPSTIIPAGGTTFALDVADIDGDGDADLLSADREAMAVTVHKNPGDGAFPVLANRYATDTGGTRIVSGDVDNDGDLDLFISGTEFGGPGAMLRNNGDGTFAAPVTYTHSSEFGRGVVNAKLRDLDGDGDLDLLYNDAQTDFFTGYDFWVGLNDGTGTFGPLTEWDLNTAGNSDIDAFDLDNDGDLDVVNLEELGFGTEGHRLWIRLNNGDATFQPAYTYQLTFQPKALGGGDLNHDGNIDLVVSHEGFVGVSTDVNVLLGNGDGTFQAPVLYAVEQGPRHLVVEDFNGDGHLDFATANTGHEQDGPETLSVLLGVGDGTFSGRQDYYAPFSSSAQGVHGLGAGDVDGDGDLDLMMTTVAGGVAMYYNDGAGSFTFPHSLGAYWTPSSPVFADFTNDGIADLALVVSGVGREIAILPGLQGQPAAPLAVSVEPVNPPLQLPPEGGTFRYKVTVENISTAQQNAQLWSTITTPNNRQLQRRPLSLNLAPGENFTRTFSQKIPGRFEAGSYSLIAAVGTFPDEVVDSASFSFEKLSGLSKDGEVD